MIRTLGIRPLHFGKISVAGLITQLIRLLVTALVAALVTVASLTLAVSLAVAAEDTGAASTEADSVTSSLEEVTPFQSMNFTAIYTEGIWVGLLSGELAEYTPLPARIEVAVPEGTLTGWFGQMPGSDGFDSALQFTESYLARTENGMDIYSAVMTHFHTMQFETRIDESPLTDGDENSMNMSLSYTPVHDVDELSLTAAFPAGFVSVEENLVFLGDGPGGEQSYSRIFEAVTAGEPVSTTISAFYVGADESATPDADPTTIIIIVCIAVAMIALTYVFFVRGKKAD
jgi:hypothetical protein